MRKRIDPNVLDTSQISKDMTIKNYKEFCKLLGEEARAGKSKILQLQRWERFIDFEQMPNSHQYVVNEVYDEPIEKPKPRRHKALYYGKYSKYLIYLLFLIVRNSRYCEGTVRTSKRRFITATGLIPPKFEKEIGDARRVVNDEYDKKVEKIKKLIEALSQECGKEIIAPKPNRQDYVEYLLNKIKEDCANADDDTRALVRTITKRNINTFIRRVEDKARCVFESAVKGMEKEGIASVIQNYNVVREDENGNYHIEPARNRMIDGAEVDENDLIRDVEQSVVEEFGYKNSGDVYLRGKVLQLYGRMEEILYEKYQIVKVFKQIRITNKVADYDFPPEFDTKSTEEIILELNQQFINGLNKQAKRQHDAVNPTYTHDVVVLDRAYKRERHKKSYIEIQSFLAKYFLTMTKEEAAALAQYVRYGINGDGKCPDEGITYYREEDSDRKYGEIDYSQYYPKPGEKFNTL